MGVNFYKIGVRMGVRTLTKIPVLISRFLVEGIKKTLQNKLKGCEESGWQDSNLRPPGPKPGAITGLRYIPNLKSSNRCLISFKDQRRDRDSNPGYSLTRTTI